MGLKCCRLRRCFLLHNTIYESPGKLKFLIVHIHIMLPLYSKYVKKSGIASCKYECATVTVFLENIHYSRALCSL